MAKDMEKIIGATITGIVVSVLAAQNDLNLTAIQQTFLTLLGWIPLAVVVQKIAKG